MTHIPAPRTHEFLSISNTSYNRTTLGCSNFLWMLYSRRACLDSGLGENKAHISRHSSPCMEVYTIAHLNISSQTVNTVHNTCTLGTDHHTTPSLTWSAIFSCVSVFYARLMVSLQVHTHPILPRPLYPAPPTLPTLPTQPSSLNVVGLLVLLPLAGQLVDLARNQAQLL